MSVLVAGFGSELRGDDGVGLRVVRELAARPLPESVRCVEVGTGGIALVHELMSGCDRLIIVDAVRRGGPPGHVSVIHPVVPQPGSAAVAVDAHAAEPGRALILARALGVLPADVHLVGIEVVDTEELTTELTPEVEQAVQVAVERAAALVLAAPAVY